MAIIWIGILTAVIGDVASAFGCSVGLQDSVTAIAFVALGTSVPGRLGLILFLLTNLTSLTTTQTNKKQ